MRCCARSCDSSSPCKGYPALAWWLGKPSVAIGVFRRSRPTSSTTRASRHRRSAHNTCSSISTQPVWHKSPHLFMKHGENSSITGVLLAGNQVSETRASEASNPNRASIKIWSHKAASRCFCSARSAGNCSGSIRARRKPAMAMPRARCASVSGTTRRRRTCRASLIRASRAERAQYRYAARRRRNPPLRTAIAPPPPPRLSWAAPRQYVKPVALRRSRPPHLEKLHFDSP